MYKERIKDKWRFSVEELDWSAERQVLIPAEHSGVTLNADLEPKINHQTPDWKKLEKGIYFLNKVPSLNCKMYILNVYPIFLEMFFIYLYYIVFLLLIMVYRLIDYLCIYFYTNFFILFSFKLFYGPPSTGDPGTQFDNPWTSLHTTLTNVPPYRLNMQSVSKMIILHSLHELGIE